MDRPEDPEGYLATAEGPRPLVVDESQRMAVLPFAQYTYGDTGEDAGVQPAWPRVSEFLFPRGSMQENPIGHAVAAGLGAFGFGAFSGVPRGALAANAARRDAGAFGDIPFDLPRGPGDRLDVVPDMPAPYVKSTNPGELFDYSLLDGIPVDNPLGLPNTPIYDAPRGASARMADALSNRSVAVNIGKAMDKGLAENPDTVLNWYNTEPLRGAFGEYYTGKSMTPDEAYSQFIDAIAATSPQNPVAKNISEGSQIYKMLQEGREIPTDNKILKRSGEGLSGVAANTKLKLSRDLQEGTLDPYNARKVMHFAGNLKGLPGVTIDAHASRLFSMPTKDPRFLNTAMRYYDDAAQQYRSYSPRDMLLSGEVSMKEALKEPTWWLSRPSKGEYKFIADKYGELAKRRGLSGSQGQAAAWYGGADKTGVVTEPKTFMGLLEDRVRDTAAMRNMSTEDVLREMINAKHKLYQQQNPIAPFLYSTTPQMDEDEGRA